MYPYIYPYTHSHSLSLPLTHTDKGTGREGIFSSVCCGRSLLPLRTTVITWTVVDLLCLLLILAAAGVLSSGFNKLCNFIDSMENSAYVNVKTDYSVNERLLERWTVDLNIYS